MIDRLVSEQPRESLQVSSGEAWEDLAVPLDRKNAMFQDVALEVIAYEAESFTASDITDAIGPHAEQNKGRVKKNIDLLREIGVVETAQETRTSTYGGRPATLFRRTEKVNEFLAQNPAIERRVRIRAIAKALGLDDIDALNYAISLGEQAVSKPGLIESEPSTEK